MKECVYGIRAIGWEDTGPWGKQKQEHEIRLGLAQDHTSSVALADISTTA